MSAPDLLLAAAARAAQEASDRALAEAAKPLPEPDPAEVERVLSTLPEMARKGRTRTPHASGFQFIEWDRLDRVAVRMAEVVRGKLQAMGLSTIGSVADGALLVEYASLFAAAAEQRRATWLAEASKLWLARGGITIRERTADQTPVLCVAEGPQKQYAATCDYLDREPAVVVAEAAKALGLPAWGNESVLLRAWREKAGENAAVELQPGRWDAGSHGLANSYRAVPCLTFTTPTASWSIDRADVHDWALADLIAMAADECGVTPAAAVSPKDASPPPSPRTEKRRGGERARSAA